MSLADHYPPMDSGSCMSIGINGGCGADCPLFRKGDCEEPGETLEHIIKFRDQYTDYTDDEIEELCDHYEPRARWLENLRSVDSSDLFGTGSK